MKKNDIHFNIIEISDEEFQKLRNLIYSSFGIHLTDLKKSLVKSRLNSLLKKLGFTNFTDYYNFLVNSTTKDSLLALIDKISTNHTYFFREDSHFEYVNNIVIPELLHNTGKSKIKIWCAGCASGEEPYSLAMSIHNYLTTNNLPVTCSILATDISTTVLEKAVAGIYKNEETIKIPPNLKHKYIVPIDKESFQLNNTIRNMILFKRLNLMRESFPFKGKFDIIFCRNVMIYFNKQTRLSLVNKFYEYTHASGYLFIGHSETLFKESIKYVYVKPAIYKKLEA